VSEQTLSVKPPWAARSYAKRQDYARTREACGGGGGVGEGRSFSPPLPPPRDGEAKRVTLLLIETPDTFWTPTMRIVVMCKANGKGEGAGSNPRSASPSAKEETDGSGNGPS
jgi:hypothetical protein